MGWNNVIFQLLIVTSTSGTPTGFFFYNGAPALGNLVAEITAPGVTSDPFGNSVPSSGVVNFGTWNAAGTLLNHFGVNNVGDIFLANASGLTVVHGHSADGSVWFYNTSGEGAGNLISSIAPAAGTDSAGNAFQAGITSYASPTTFAQLVNQSLRFATAQSVILPNVTGGATATESHIQMGSGTGPEAGATLASLQLGDSGNSLPGLTVSAPDGNTYDTERLTLLTAGVTINSAVAPVTIFTHHLGVGTYEIEIWLVTSNAAATAAQYAFSGSGGLVIGAGVGPLVEYESTTTGTAVDGYFASSAFNATFNGQGTGGNQRLKVRATFQVTTPGTLTFGGKELMAGNTITVFSGGRMDICPVVAT